MSRFQLLTLVVLLGIGGCQSGVKTKATQADELPAAVQGIAPKLGGNLVQYDGSDPDVVGYLAVPRSKGMFPGVVLIHDASGPTDRMREMADAFAGEGYTALVVTLFEGPIDEDQILESIEDIHRNLDTAVDFLRQRAGSSGSVATIGWGVGSDIALSYAFSGADIQGTALFHGSLPDYLDLERARVLRHEVYGTFLSTQDAATVERVQYLSKYLGARGSSAAIFTYEELGEGFWFSSEPSSNDSWVKRDSWIRLKAYLSRVLR